MIDVTTRLEVEECPTCFVNYAVSKAMLKRKQEQGGHWYCPNGHQVIYSRTEVQRLRDELEKAQRAAILAREEADAARTEAHNATATAKREVTRRQNIQKRIHAGVCPECHRHFTNVERHMNTKHPKEERHA